METYEKYLISENVSKAQAFEKLKGVIKSCKTKAQLDIAINMADSFVKLYGQSFFDKIYDFVSGIESYTTGAREEILAMIDARLLSIAKAHKLQ